MSDAEIATLLHAFGLLDRASIMISGTLFFTSKVRRRIFRVDGLHTSPDRFRDIFTAAAKGIEEPGPVTNNYLDNRIQDIVRTRKSLAEEIVDPDSKGPVDEDREQLVKDAMFMLDYASNLLGRAKKKGKVNDSTPSHDVEGGRSSHN